MPERPLLHLPSPNSVKPPKNGGGGDKIRFPSRDHQKERFGPVFNRLNAALANGNLSGLRDDPSGLAPDRVIVFEIAGDIKDFLKAVARIKGLEFMAEQAKDFQPDPQRLTVADKRRGREENDRLDKPVPGRLYLAMPDVQALRELLSLWNMWEKGEGIKRGFTPFAHLFKQLQDVRPWGPQDRIPSETVRYWEEKSGQKSDQPIRTEVELWYHGGDTRRRDVSNRLRHLIKEAGGQVVHESVIQEISYHGMLIDIPANDIQNLIRERTVRLALADDIMFLRPQSVMRGPLNIETEVGTAASLQTPSSSASPIAALLDGVPVQGHDLIAERLKLDDPDDLQSRALVSQRRHGTAMASLIIHGDRNEAQAPLSRPLYVRPIMITADEEERTENDRLLVDTIRRAVLRIKEESVAPTVFLVNLSMGDARRPFAGTMSPLARLLDFLAARYNILFLTSGGNVSDPLTLSDFGRWTDFEEAKPADREKAVLKALNESKHERTIISPAESLNALTIGAQHHDGVRDRPPPPMTIDPFQDNAMPNVSSGLGLGYRRMIKPDLFFPGGRERVRLKSAGDGSAGLTISVASPQRAYGLSAAAPDSQNLGRLDQVALIGGTSAATALATRAGHRIFEALTGEDGDSSFRDMDPQFYAVVVKALLVHSARWNGNDKLLQEICGPPEPSRHVERSENSSRFIGFGVPAIHEVFECSQNRATLVGFGTMKPKTCQNFRIPLPDCLESVTNARALTVTVAWFSPIKPGHQRYRCVRLEAAPSLPNETLGVERKNVCQPADSAVKRGSVFHERFHGESAVAFRDEGHLSLNVWCREDAGIDNTEVIRYGIAVTIESEPELHVYDQIKERLLVGLRSQ